MSARRWVAVPRLLIVTAIAGPVWLGLVPVPVTRGSESRNAPDENAVRAAIARATPLLAALEAYKTREGRYPRSLDDLIPRHLRAIPDASAANEAKSSFVYHGNPDAFEIFFLVRPSSDLFLFSSSRTYPARRDGGPYELIRTIGDWSWYRVIPMRQAVIVKEWKGRLPGEKEPARFDVVTDAQTLARLWKEWQVGGTPPAVDFRRHIVLAAVVRSGLVLFKEPRIDDRGNLEPNVVATPDAPPYYSWVIGIVERDGIRSVSGRPL